MISALALIGSFGESTGVGGMGPTPLSQQISGADIAGSDLKVEMQTRFRIPLDLTCYTRILNSTTSTWGTQRRKHSCYP